MRTKITLKMAKQFIKMNIEEKDLTSRMTEKEKIIDCQLLTLYQSLTDNISVALTKDFTHTQYNIEHLEKIDEFLDLLEREAQLQRIGAIN